jgi:putative tryptophan/tyrosine transport system substrate-binding protein
MKKRIFSFALSAMLIALCVPATAQQPAKLPRIGWLTGAPFSGNPERREAFRQGLHELGYVEGKNIIIEWRTADGKRDRYPAVLAELLRLKVDVIICDSAGSTRHAKEATSTIPIVMTNDGDPVGQGFVASLARPGGNITGLSTLSRGQKPAPGDIPQARLCGSWRAYELRREPGRLGPPHRRLCGQDSERSEARRSTSRATDEV